MGEKKELEKIVGENNVLDNLETLEQFSQDLSFAPKVRPSFIVRPQDAGQVQSIVKWANETRTPLVPVSSGPPHFKGDTVPSEGRAVIVDFNNMKRIPRIDPLNRVAMVEPGVTFGELQVELKKEGLTAYLPLCPRSSKSVVGSMLEREPITMPSHHWDGLDPLLNAEMIFGTGDKLRGGEACGPNTLEEQWEIGKAQMCPFGLSQFNEHRLLSGAQGTIGLVTWATLKCRRISKLSNTFLVPSDSIEPLIDLSYKLLRIRLGDHCFILNNLNLACLFAQTADEIEKLRANLPPWVLVISFEGYGDLPEEKVRYQTSDFKKLAISCQLDIKTVIPGIKGEDISKLLCEPSSEPYWKLRYKGECFDTFFLTTQFNITSFAN